MIMLAVVSSRIFDCPCSRNDIVGGMLRPASILRTSFDASSSAWPGATSAMRLTVNCRFERCSVVGPRPRSSRAMLSMRTGPVGDGTVSRPISAMSRRWFSSTRILTGYCSCPSLKNEIWSSPETARRSVLPMVAIRTPRSAARLRSTATWTSGFDTFRPILASVRLGTSLRRGERLLRVLRNLLADPGRGCSPRSRTRRCPSPLPSALRELMLGR